MNHLCTVDGCDRPRNSGELCQTHRRRVARNGTLEPRRHRQSHCNVADCDRKHYGKGMCHKHWQRSRKTGTTAAPTSTRPAPAIPMPRNAHQAAGLGLTDALQLACDVRDLDPEEVWRTIASWRPTRIAAALIVAAALIPDDQPTSDLLEWTQPQAPKLRSVS